jgi:hypothetical protein
MGFRYILYRVYHVFLIKSRLIKLVFPTSHKFENLVSLEDWRSSSKPFFFSSRASLGYFEISESKKAALKADYEQIKAGNLQYFNNKWIHVGLPFDWHLNTDSGYRYPKNVHWAYIPDLSATNGDIKYVWEKSRFSFLYTVIRYDQHFNTDSSAFVFELIADWIQQNPTNQGPNYKCSQEISLRLLNWTFALYFYKNSKKLDEALFGKILQSMREQLIHVYRNIHFSRITVRNNHAITETMCLCVMGVLFPSFPESKKYVERGLAYFEEEVAYQIYADGSYLQFSMNYHRVVVQLLTWAINIAELNDMTISDVVYQRAKASLVFLQNTQDDSTGTLPNYGANDGALFFKLNNENFLNYAPQLNGLAYALNRCNGYKDIDLQEDAWWYNGGNLNHSKLRLPQKAQIYEAPVGGFYVLRDAEYFSMLRCGNHNDRPQQADQNHLDILYKGHNILRDNGTYKYNTDNETVNYFSGTASHNTVQIGNHNQMLKGGRFIWYYWSQANSVQVKNTASYATIVANAAVYKQLGKISHTRIVKQYHEQVKWEIEDILNTDRYHQNEPFKQLWHIADNFFELGFQIKSYDKNGVELPMSIIEAFNSKYYGEKQNSKCVQFENTKPYFITVIYKA